MPARSNQVFSRWAPLADIDVKLYLEELRHDPDGLHLRLAPPRQAARMLCLFFENFLAYRSADEGDLLKTVGPDTTGASLFTVTHSEFIDWFVDQTLGVRSSDPIQHYAIYTPNECVDILSLAPPKVWWQR